jgi:hypothetical protein
LICLQNESIEDIRRDCVEENEHEIVGARAGERFPFAWKKRSEASLLI